MELRGMASYSLDLSPTENLWALLKAELYKIRPDLLDVRNNNEIKAILVETAQIAWERLDLDHLKHLSDTMPHRVQGIIESEGWYTPY
jgi:hypothetical protein